MGTKSKKKAKTRLDAYYRLAKDQGYRARSAFKLIQLNRKYDFLAKAHSLVDLCAAPGGWCQVAAQFMPVGSKIVGVDLVPIAPIRGVKTFVGDITDDKTRKTIKTWLKKEPVDCVIHDGAPNVGGVWSQDLFAQNALVLLATKMACDLLRPGGWFVTKVFRSPDYQKLMWVLKSLFEKVEGTKPLASRMESAEIFVVCQGYKAPRQLDPKLFQAQFVFSDVGDEKITLPSGVMAMPRTNVPQGYEEFATIPNKVVTLTDFLESPDAKTLLMTQHEIRFQSDEEKLLLRSRYAKPELVHLCYDLQQVGEADRRRLLRMREQLLRERLSVRTAAADRARAAAGARSGGGAAAAAAYGGSDDGGDGGDIEELEIDDEAELDGMARELLAQKRAEEKARKKRAKKLVDSKLKKVRGLINFNPNEAGANAPDRVDSEDGSAGGGSGRDDDDDDENDGDLDIIARLGRFSEEEIARALDKYAEDVVDNDRGKNMPNIPLNAINDVRLDPDDDMGNAGALDEHAEEEWDVNAHILDTAEGELDVDDAGNYVRAKVPAVGERFRVGRAPAAAAGDAAGAQRGRVRAAAAAAAIDSDGDGDGDGDDAALGEDEAAAVRAQAKRDKREAQLEAAGKQSKWERRHLNVDQVLRETFARPKQQKRSTRAAVRLEEDLVEMRDPDAAPAAAAGAAARGAPGSAAAATRKLLAAERQAVLARRFHDESDASDSDDIDSMQALYSDEDRDDGGGSDGEGDEEDDARARVTAARMMRVHKGKNSGKSSKKTKFIPDVSKLTAQEHAKALRKQVEKQNKKGKKAKDGAFEEIPMAMTDPTVRARTLALATKMLDKRTRQHTLEAGVHRYMNNDDEDLPDWFLDDEHKHYQLNLPVTAAELDAQRQRFTEMNSRPSKRVAEAVGRKRRKAQRMVRSLIEKGKTDPTVRSKANKTTVRMLMRSKLLKGGPAARGKKKGPIDTKKKGEMKRDKQRVKKANSKKGKRR